MRLPVPSNSYAVLIGTSTYRNSNLPGLPAVRHNLDDLAAVLTDPGLSGLPADHCIVVPDPAEVRALYRELQRHAARATDTLIVYFAGHGLTGPRNELFLTLTDTDTDELPVSALAYDLVRDVIGGSPATNRVVILDCCFSGSAAGEMAGKESVHGQTAIEGTYVLTATSANAVALAPPDARYTVFTGELLRLLRSGVPEGPELLSFGTIYRHLLHVMTTRGLPLPRQRGTGTADQLALARNRAHEPEPEPAPTPAAAPVLAPVLAPAPVLASASTSVADSLPAAPSQATSSQATSPSATPSTATVLPATPSSATPSEAVHSQATPSPSMPSLATPTPATSSPAAPLHATPSPAVLSLAASSPEPASPAAPPPETTSPAAGSGAPQTGPYGEDHGPLGSWRSRRGWQVVAAAVGVACTALMALAGSSSAWRGVSWVGVSAFSLVQGLSSALPVSPSAHLTLVERVLPPGADGLIPALDLAPVAALLAYLVGDVWRAVRATARDPLPGNGSSVDVRLGRYLFIGVGATVISAPILGSFIVRPNLWLIAAGAATTAVLLGAGEMFGRKDREVCGFATRDGLVIGAAYLGALVLPGTSSLGAGLAAGLLLGFTRLAALRLALMFAVASKVSGAVLALLFHGIAARASEGPTATQLLVGVLVTFALTYVSVAGLLRYVRHRSLYPFTVYLLLLAGVVSGALAAGVLSAS